jgi:UDP-N-acetyl-2-amino-2-deoxyglucuronate dehydrogenase
MAVRFAMVGCGMISNFHAAAIADAPDASLVGCFSRSLDKTKAFADKHGCRVFETLEQLLADSEVDAVTICSPSGAHLEPALAAAAAGKHIIVEKPLEITTERCDKIIRAAADANVKLGVTFQSRFHESAQLLKAAIDAGRFGTITLGDAYVKWFRSQAYYDSGAWRGTWALDGGGALMNQAIHSVDLLLWLMGPVAEVNARTATMTHERIEVEDVAVAHLLFQSGALGVIEATTTAFPGSLKRIEISGNQGMAILEEEDLKQWQFAQETAEDEAIRQRMAGRTKTGGGAGDPAAIGHHGHTLLFNEFTAAIQQDRVPLIDGTEGRRSVQLIEAIYQSSKSRKTVHLHADH